MARKRDILCAGTCGQMIYSGKGCLPAGQAMCWPCRRLRVRVELRTCAGCGVQFSARSMSVARSCSRPCAQRVRYGLIDRTRSCEVCASEFAPHRGGNSVGQRTCGRACGIELRRRSRVERACEACGRQFEAGGLGNKRYCSTRCRPKPEPVTRPCSECEQLFTGGAGLTCSRDCARVAKRRRDQEYNALRPKSDWDRSARVCQHCDLEFTPTKVGQVYHDEVCARRAKRKRERASGVRYSGDLHRHRARKYGRKYVPIKPLKIFERDGWICQICMKRVPKNKVSPHPLSPTLDHIIPMSCEGGDHVPENVQLAHFKCNTDRGTGGTVQLLLIG